MVGIKLKWEQVIDRVTAKWKTLQHPNILSFIGTGTLSDPPFIAHAFASNGPILAYLAKNPAADRMQLVCDPVVFSCAPTNDSTAIGSGYRYRIIPSAFSPRTSW
jgi:hypothetical protein